MRPSADEIITEGMKLRELVREIFALLKRYELEGIKITGMGTGLELETSTAAENLLIFLRTKLK